MVGWIKIQDETCLRKRGWLRLCVNTPSKHGQHVFVVSFLPTSIAARSRCKSLRQTAAKAARAEHIPPFRFACARPSPIYGPIRTWGMRKLIQADSSPYSVAKLVDEIMRFAFPSTVFRYIQPTLCFRKLYLAEARNLSSHRVSGRPCRRWVPRRTCHANSSRDSK